MVTKIATKAKVPAKIVKATPAAKFHPNGNKTSLLEAAKVASPHKAHQFGWDKEAALALAAEFGAQLFPGMTCAEMAVLWGQYVTFAGHKSLAREFIKKFKIQGDNDR